MLEEIVRVRVVALTPDALDSARAIIEGAVPVVNAEGIKATAQLLNGPAPVAVERAAGAARLTARETKIVACLTEALPNKVIAERLGISEATVKVYLKNALYKLGLPNRTALGLWAAQQGMGR